MVYLCWAIAAKRGRAEDASAIQVMLTSMSANNPEIRRDHSDYGILSKLLYVNHLAGGGMSGQFRCALIESKFGENREQSCTDHRGPSSVISNSVEVGLFPHNAPDSDLPFEKIFRY